MKKILPAVALAGGLVAFWPLGSSVVTAQTAASTNTNLKLPLKLRAWAVNMSNVATGTNTIVDFTVNQWSSEMERSAFITTFLEKGPNDLLKALQKAPAKGRMRYPNITGPDERNMRLGWDLKYAWRTPLDEGGDRLMLALDRYIGFWEATSLSRTNDYPFTFIEIHLPREGKGVGTMALGTKLEFDKKKNQVIMENFSSEPVRLQEISIEK